jgi:hypothetical protein
MSESFQVRLPFVTNTSSRKFRELLRSYITHPRPLRDPGAGRYAANFRVDLDELRLAACKARMSRTSIARALLNDASKRKPAGFKIAVPLERAPQTAPQQASLSVSSKIESTNQVVTRRPVRRDSVRTTPAPQIVSSPKCWTCGDTGLLGASVPCPRCDDGLRAELEGAK